MIIQLLHSDIIIIIELVDSISRDGPDSPICVIHYKNADNSVQLTLGLSNLHILDLEKISYPTSPRMSMETVANV